MRTLSQCFSIYVRNSWRYTKISYCLSCFLVANSMLQNIMYLMETSSMKKYNLNYIFIEIYFLNKWAKLNGLKKLLIYNVCSHFRWINLQTMLLEWMQAAAHLSSKPCHLGPVGNEGTQNIGIWKLEELRCHPEFVQEPKPHESYKNIIWMLHRKNTGVIDTGRWKHEVRSDVSFPQQSRGIAYCIGISKESQILIPLFQTSP
jgi:hypothetical protein